MKKIILTKEQAASSASVLRYLVEDLTKEKDSEMKSGMIAVFNDAIVALTMVDDEGITFEFPDDIPEGDVFNKDGDVVESDR